MHMSPFVGKSTTTTTNKMNESFNKYNPLAEIWTLANIYRRKGMYSTQNIPQNRIEGNNSQFILWGHHYSDAKTRQKHYLKKYIQTYRLTLFMNINAKTCNNISTHTIQEYIKRIIYTWNGRQVSLKRPNW